MKVELLAITPDAEKLVERCGRICYNSESKTTDNSHGGFIKGLIKSGHESVLEHASATFYLTGVSRAMTHQLVRHRVASYSQQSQRYVKETEPEYVIPPSIESSNDLSPIYFESLMDKCWETYNKLIQNGVKPEDARFVLPNACETKIALTMNFRELRHFFKLRCDKHAQWEIQDVSKEMLKELVKYAPSVFSDLYDIYIYEDGGLGG